MSSLLPPCSLFLLQCPKPPTALFPFHPGGNAKSWPRPTGRSPPRGASPHQPVVLCSVLERARGCALPWKPPLLLECTSSGEPQASSRATLLSPPTGSNHLPGAACIKQHIFPLQIFPTLLLLFFPKCHRPSHCIFVYRVSPATKHFMGTGTFLFLITVSSAPRTAPRMQ